MKPRITSGQYLAAASLLTVFVIDIITPTTFVIDILYLCCVLLVFKHSIRTIVGFSAAACVLIVFNVLFFEHWSALTPAVLINRGISIFAVLITSYIAIHYRKVSQASKKQEEQYLQALTEMLFITSHQVRKPVASILGLIDVVTMDTENISSADLRQYCEYLRDSAIELDGFIRKLNEFIADTEEQNRSILFSK